MGVIVGSSLIISLVAVVAGWMGSHDQLGFTVMSRAYVLVQHFTKLPIMEADKPQFLGNDWWILASA